MRTKLLAALGFVFAICSLPAPGQTSIPLWQNAAPGSEDAAPKDIPMLTSFLPAHPAGLTSAVIICPGGGYRFLSIENEGSYEAKWFQARGVAAFVLRYRLPADGYRFPTPLLDAQRAVRLVRSHASEWNIDSRKIGVMGFSAGGHLAATLETHYDLGDAMASDRIDSVSCRPDFAVLVYALIDVIDPTFRLLLLGPNPDPALLSILADDQQVDAQTPPTFLVAATDDGKVPIDNSRKMFAALQKAGVLSAFREYPRGGHGFGAGGPVGWMDRMCEWLKAQGFMP